MESLSPHRVLGVDADDELIDTQKEDGAEFGAKQSFPQMILENLNTAGVQQAHKEDRINFTALIPWPGDLVCAEGHYLEGETEKRAAIFIGPEFGTVQRADLVAAAREAGDAAFDVLIACAFNYEAHATEFSKLGRIPVLKARMNADLHMAEDLKNTGKGNLFVIFGEPDIDLITETDGQMRGRRRVGRPRLRVERCTPVCRPDQPTVSGRRAGRLCGQSDRWRIHDQESERQVHVWLRLVVQRVVWSRRAGGELSVGSPPQPA